MKALSLWQPWASLIALGVKTVETRSWATSYRGPLAIHAAKRPFGFNSAEAELVRAMPLELYRRLNRHLRGDPEMWDNYPLGAVIATGTLFACVPTEAIGWAPDGRSYAWGYRCGRAVVVESQRAYGDYSDGRYAWLLADIEPLPEPVPAKGRQGLWEWAP